MTKTKGRSCEGKRKFLSRRAALEYCRYRHATFGATRSHTDIYKCNYCGYFHVGHKPRRRRANG